MSKRVAAVLCLFWFETVVILRLLEAITQKKPNTVSCDADEIDIYSQKESFACPSHSHLPLPCLSLTLQEGGWVREMKKQQSTAANPSRALGSDAFQLWVLLSRSSGQIATDLCYQLEMHQTGCLP